MENLDPLLKKQIDELIGDRQEIPERLNDLLAKVSETYDNLRQQAYRHKLVSESFPAFVFIASPDLEEIYYANRKLEEQFDLDREKFYQDPVGCLQEYVSSGETMLEEKLEGVLEKPLASEFKLNGDQWLRMKLLPCPVDGGEGQYLVGIFHDVTTEKKTKDSLLENIVEQREIIFNKMPGLLQKNIALVKNRLRDMYHRKEEEKEDGEDCKHCLVWVQAVDIAYENIRHHSESAEVDMFSYVKQLCQYVMSLHGGDIEPPLLELEEVKLAPDRAISCGIFQFESVMALYNRGAQEVKCQLSSTVDGYCYRITWHNSGVSGSELVESLSDKMLETVVEEGLEGKLRYEDSEPGKLEVVFPA